MDTPIDNLEEKIFLQRTYDKHEALFENVYTFETSVWKQRARKIYIYVWISTS